MHSFPRPGTLLRGAALLACTPAFAQSQFVPLGDLPGGDVFSGATAINPDGTAVVGFGWNGTATEAFLWTPTGGMVGLGLLPGGWSTIAADVNGDGTVVVGEAGAPGTHEPFVWSTTAGLQGLGTGTFDFGEATGVSADGLTVVGTLESTTAPSQAFTWTLAQGFMTVSDPKSSASGCSADAGVLVGSLPNVDGIRRAMRWEPTGGTKILAGLGSESFACDDDGNVVVGERMNSATGYPTAFRWQKSTGALSLDPQDFFQRSRGNGVDADGSTVVGWAYRPLGGPRAFVWTKEMGMQSVKELLMLTGVPGMNSWYLLEAHDVSADGLTIVGEGSYGATHQGWVAHLPQALGTPLCNQATENSTGDVGRILAFGSTSVAENDVLLGALHLPANTFGIFLNSRQPGVTVPPGSQGTLCLGGAIGRYSDHLLDSGSTGMFSLQLDLAQTPTPSGPVAVLPGETWYFQAWYRDQNPTQTSNFTDSRSIAFE